MPEAGVDTFGRRRIWALRMRVSISPNGSFITIARSPYQLDLTMPGMRPWLASSRSWLRHIPSLR